MDTNREFFFLHLLIQFNSTVITQWPNLSDQFPLIWSLGKYTHCNYNSLRSGQPLFVISLIFASICFCTFGGQSSAAYPFNFDARLDLSSSSSGRFPVRWRRNEFCLSSNFCVITSGNASQNYMEIKINCYS